MGFLFLNFKFSLTQRVHGVDMVEDFIMPDHARTLAGHNVDDMEKGLAV